MIYGLVSSINFELMKGREFQNSEKQEIAQTLLSCIPRFESLHPNYINTYLCAASHSTNRLTSYKSI